MVTNTTPTAFIMIRKTWCRTLYTSIYTQSFEMYLETSGSFLSKTCCSKFIRPVLKHGPRSATCMRVLGWKTHLHNESEDVSLLSQEPARKHIVVMYAMQFFMVHLLAIIWFHIKMIHHHPHSSTRQKATTDKSSLLL